MCLLQADHLYSKFGTKLVCALLSCHKSSLDYLPDFCFWFVAHFLLISIIIT